MTRKLIEMRLKRIPMADDENAHRKEDILYADFIKWIAAEAPEPYASLAALVLTTKDMNLRRWYS